MLVFSAATEVDAFQINNLEFVRSEVTSVTAGDGSFIVLTKDRAAIVGSDFQMLGELFDIIQAYYAGEGRYIVLYAHYNDLEIKLYNHRDGSYTSLLLFSMDQISGIQFASEYILIQFGDASRLFWLGKLIAKFNCGDIKRADLHERTLTILDASNVLRVFSVDKTGIQQISKVKISMNFTTHVFAHSRFLIVLGEKMLVIDLRRKEFLSQVRQNTGAAVNCMFSDLGDYAFLSQGYRLTVVNNYALKVVKILATQFPGVITSGQYAIMRESSENRNIIAWVNISESLRDSVERNEARRQAMQPCPSIAGYEQYDKSYEEMLRHHANNACGNSHKICSIDSYFTSYVGAARSRLFVGSWDGTLQVYDFIDV